MVHDLLKMISSEVKVVPHSEILEVISNSNVNSTESNEELLALRRCGCLLVRFLR